MILFDGKKVAQKILGDIKKHIKKENIRPGLAVILIGDDESSRLYVRLKKEAAKKIGIAFSEINFSREAKQEEIIAKIKELNEDEKIHGVIVQLPLPAVFNGDEIIASIKPEKDVDGFHLENRRLLEKGKEPFFLPVFPMAIMQAIESALNNFSAKKALALVNSQVFGETLKLVLERNGIQADYMVRNTCVVFGAEKEVHEADILIMALGCPSFIKGDVIKEGAILIDGGVTRFHDGKVVGDVDAKRVQSKAAFLTPVPGGLGPLTVALLLKNVYLSASKISSMELLQKIK
ncbi:MAG: bifunctional 5,10-methylenetetrahydrofolate dehydrogenase/5,10-methenyltetrahydrofolate cyclohydrolase [Candidatus Portnoybacteria bacterium]|nr:bifunctional 5,10-methylenetetrahydrofolate dehydrogenase/5,10-methenyltetrahydrofolate cyclohydrolase [Candidatus Portnoybacteria bacterium]